MSHHLATQPSHPGRKITIDNHYKKYKSLREKIKMIKLSKPLMDEILYKFLKLLGLILYGQCH